MQDDLQVVRAELLTAGQLNAVRRIYDDGFPPELQVPFPELTSGGPADLLLAAVVRGRPVGFASQMRLGPDWTFLRYYAVAPECRRQGAGLKLWQLVRATLASAGWPSQVVLEVENPGHARTAAEFDIRTGRIAFWERCGARLIDLPGYLMPDISGLASPEPMLLMTVPASDGAAPRPAEVARLVAEVYSRRYGLGSDHPMVSAALASIPGAEPG
jgi:GNAT superfamily N-acetyltransferase